jgi:hypothetical protein
VDGHRDLPSDGHEVDAMAITEGNQIRWSSHRKICSTTVSLPSMNFGQHGQMRRRLRAYLPVRVAWSAGLQAEVPHGALR